MGTFSCPSGREIWDGVDFESCFRDRIINSLFPLVLLALSLSYLLLTNLYAFLQSRLNPQPAIALPTTDLSSLVPSSSSSSKAERISPLVLENTVIHEAALDAFGREPSLPRSQLEKLASWLVLLLSLALLAVEVVRGALGGGGGRSESWGSVALATYLVVLSLLSSSKSFGIHVLGLKRGDLDAHRTSLSILYFVIALVSFRSSLINKGSEDKAELVLNALAPSILMAVILLDTCVPYRSELDGALMGQQSRGMYYERPVDQGLTGEGEEGEKKSKKPMIEEPRSLASRALFTYMNPVIYKYFWTSITAADVPSLREDDHSAVVVGGWREFRERERRGLGAEQEEDMKWGEGNLAWKLMVYFKGYFLLQGLWSTVYVLATYTSPLALNLVLKFIAYRKLSLADPVTYPPQPNHLAYSYVALMFIGGCIASVAHGYSLWLGRRICIRLRSIIVGEVFAKALRRTDTASATKALTQPGAGDPLADASAEIVAGEDEARSNEPAVVTKKSKKDKKDDEKKEEQKEEASEGKVLNLVSVDAYSISEIAAYLQFLFPESPLSIFLSVFFLYRLLGWSALIGFATLVALLPIQMYFSKLFVDVQKKLLVATDARLNLATEVLGAIRLVKFNAWEKRFYTRMQETRIKELKLLRDRFVVWIMQGVLSWGTPALVTVVTFAAHVKLFDEPLKTDVAFTALALFNMLRGPLEALTDMIAHVLAAYVSTKRVQDFLNQPETAKYSNLTVVSASDDPSIGFQNATVSYSEEDDTAFSLKDLNLSFPEGQLSIVAGSVGSGKTTLLLSLLGETRLKTGKIFMHEHFARGSAPLDPTTGFSRTVAYCPQQPWLIGASIRANITFGSPYDEKRYLATLKACQLERDLEIFELGDETEVGEKGTACSGGQKARIALARAVYSRSSTILLDDVLSAVDAHTARFLYANCLKGSLLKGRTIILVTHAVGLCLPGAAFGVVLENGSVLASGSPQDLKDSNVFPEDALADSGADDHDHEESGETAAEGGELEALAAEEDGEIDLEAAKKLKEKRESKKLVKEETSATGGVSADVYKLYMSSMGSLTFWIFLVVLFLGSQYTQVGTNLWIRTWASQYDNRAESIMNMNVFSFLAVPMHHLINQASPVASDNVTIQMFDIEPVPQASETYYLVGYAIISLAYMLTIAVRMAALFNGSLTASRVLYERLLQRLLSARIRFFDSTPSGRILNRLSKDMQQIDQEAAPILMYFFTSVLASVAVLIVITFSTPLFLAAATFIVLLYWVIGALYLSISRQLKRIESVSRSPVYVCFAETLTGMTSIRAYGDTTRFVSQCLELLDTNNAPFLLLWQCNRWLSVCCDIAGGLVGLFAASFILLNPEMDAGLAGFALSYSLTFNESVLWIVRLYSACEISLNSVERVGEYLDLEIEEEEKGIEPPASWPSRDGAIEVKNLTARYAPELEPVLKDVSFTVQAGERVGICGRTGSGKSTLALTFFRFLEADSGTIEIDGLDIGKMSLETLRSRLTIVAQDAQLFQGTVRDNLDPFNLFEDVELWQALVGVRMASWSTPAASRFNSRPPSRVTSSANVAGLGSGGSSTAVNEEAEQVGSQITSLEDGVSAGGKNFSAGQRQLLALARGLLKLKNSSILLLDESTANLDHATDAAIQETLRSPVFDAVTTLIVAHRLRTVVECDKILVLDSGKVVEFGPPVELLEKEGEGARFRQLADRSGEIVVLKEMAQTAHEARTKAKK